MPSFFRVGAAAVLVAAALTLLLSRSPAPAATGPTSFAAGSLIIPMDTDTSGNHATYNQNLGMWKAYGLVDRLLQNGIPVSWGILEAKTAITDVDVSVASVHDLRTDTALGSWDYRGGPFIVDSADAAAAEPIIRAWWAANANQPNVHVAQTGFDADVNVTLRSAPRIAEDAVNANIAIGYFNAAGIPDSTGKPWTTSSPDVLTQAQIAGGALFEQGTVCPQRKYDTFVTPHNSGYSYSLTDPANLGTKAYAQLDTFVHDGGGWTALCHSILSNENAIADLTLNGSPAVKSLFKADLPGGDPGGFLTKTGFPKIDNVGGTWAVNPDAAGLPIAQLVGTTGAQALPGGSVQTWPAPGNAGAPTYWEHTERVASFTAAGVAHDQIISGTYHDGTGQGKLTFIGGHQFSTSLPYAGNTNGPYVRAFYNSLFFNGAAVAKLDLTTSPATYPQNGTALLNVSITNTGGSVATATRDVGITLAPGFTYVATVSGPAPVVDGQHLVWPDGLGDVDGGATPVTIHVSVDPSVSGTVGPTQLGTFHAAYGDVFGEGFTADVCRDITITPVPAPTLTKTPATQGPVAPGATVTWTLAYGNTGAAALQAAVLQDTLPKGFGFVSSTPAPSAVIPAASGTILRWTLGSIPANTASAGTVTIVARAGAVTDGTGTPPQQTFTNHATLTGTDAAGTPFGNAADADVVVQSLDITLGKSVDKTYVTSLPGEVTYTLTPEAAGDSLLSNVRVVDPYPAGLTAPPSSISAGGTYGAYVPIAGEPGDDPGPPHLASAIAVDHSIVTAGGSVTVTLHLTSSTTIANVTPNELGVTGGEADCTGPTPATASVGTAGTDFAWSCTLGDTGEYVFNGSAGDATDTYAWPTASSASVLSTAGGGPSVVTWNLGSTTAPVPGEIITSGTTSGVFAFRGAGNTNFQRYDTTSGGWAAMASAPAKVNPGGALTTDGKTVWGMSGDGKQAFWAYDVDAGTWTAKANTGVNIKAGGALQYLSVGGHDYVFALVGNGTNGFRRYDVAANTWAAMAVTPGNVKEGGALTTDGTYVYALQGNGGGTYAGKGFWRYDPVANSWTALANTPDVVKWGGSLALIGNYIYAFEGGGKNVFWRYDIANNTWSALASTPEKVQDGGSLTTDGTNLYAFVGKTKTFYLYDVAANRWTRLADFPPGNVGQGGALVYVPGNNPHGRFTSLSASRSLVGGGDTITVTFTARSTDGVTGVTPGDLVTTPTGGASCSSLSGPTLTSADADSTGFDDPVTYEWTCTVAAGATPGSLTFSDTTAAGTATQGPVTFPAATSNSALVTPALTFTATVPQGAPSEIVDQALLIANGQTANSPPVSTFVGEPALTVTKSNAPGAGTELRPGEPIRYTMVVENTGVATATNVVVTDPVPQYTVYTSCSGGTSCAEADGTVTWHVGSLAPGDTATVSFDVAASSELAISGTPYTITNTASATSSETPTPSVSNETTNVVSVQPQILKSVSRTEAATGDTLTYTLTVSNPGAAFTGSVSDPVPAGTELVAGSCNPACDSFAGGTVRWNGVTFPPGTTTFSFDVTVTAGGGATVTDTGTLQPTTPNVPAIDSNPVETAIGPELAVVKINDPTGTVARDDTITYTLLVSNESDVTATGVTVADPVPVGTSYDSGSCAPACSASAGVVTWQLGALPGGASVTLTFTVTVGTPPLGTFQIGNQAQVTAANTPEAPTSNVVYNTLPFAELQLTKTADRATYAAVGEVIHYTYVVRNNSTTTTLAGPVAVTDDSGVAVDCPTTAVAPLAAITCTGEHTVTQEDLDAGSIVNTATAHANGLDSNEAQATVPAAPDPSLRLTKSITAHATYTAVGQTIAYSYLVENTGNVSISDIKVEDDNVDDDPVCPGGNLAPGASVTCTAAHTVTQDDLDAGQVVNAATASGLGVVSNTDSATAHADPTAGISITKSATTEGDTVTYTFVVENTGTVTITSFEVTDQLVGLSPVDCHGATELAPGGRATCTATYTIAQADVDAGAISNTATVDGTTASAGDVTDQDTISTPVTQTPAVTIVKTSNATAATAAGDTIVYRFLVRNTGTVTIAPFRVTDPLVSPIHCGRVTSLAPGAAAVCRGTYTVTQGDVDAGSITNTATVRGTTATAGDVTASDTLVTSLTRAPALELAKTGAVTGSGSDGGAVPGDEIAYELTATNTGNTTLHHVTITDSQLGPQALTCTPEQPATLAPGAHLVCTGSHTLTQEDIDAGTVANTASADSDETAPTEAPATVTVPRVPALTLVKHDVLDVTIVKPAKRRADAGDRIDYTLTATNSGNTTLHDVRITDPALGTLTCTPDQPATLAPGETLECSGSHTLSQTEIDAGKAVNTATATSTEAPPADATNEVGLTRVPGITFVKHGVAGTTVAAGDLVRYRLVAINTGNTTLNDVVIADPKLGTLVCTPAQPAVLAPGEALRCTGSYTLTQADIDQGDVENTATVVSTETPTPKEAPSDVTLPQASVLELAKDGDLVTSVVEPAGRADAGDRVDYTLTATNAGNTTLHGVTIVDSQLGPDALTCTPSQPVAALAPGATLTCTGSHVLTQADVDAGEVVNSATAKSAEVSPPPVSERVALPPAPGLSLEKSATLDQTVKAPTDRVDAGDRADYTLTATNTGNTTLHHVAITDTKLGALSCMPAEPVASLAPGDTVECKGSYTLTQADLDAGTVTNTSSAVSDETPTPTEASATVPLTKAPGLSLSKDGELVTSVVPPNARADVGDRVDYTLTATNTGNTTLTGVTIADPSLGPLTCRAPTPLPTPTSPVTLRPGQQLVCTGSHTLTQAEIDAGKVDNTATADSNETPPTDASESVAVPPAPALTLDKTATLDMTVVPPSNRADAGDKIAYVLTATNAGNTTLHDVTIIDTKLGAVNCTPPQPVAALAPGDTFECTGSYTLTQADVNAGQVVNNATARSTEATSPPASQTVTLPPASALELTKKGEVDMTVAGLDDRVDAGDRVTYTLTATNTGNVTLTGVRITDPKLGALTCRAPTPLPTPTSPATLAPGQQLICTGSYTVTQADIDAGKVTNSATAVSDQTSPTVTPNEVLLPQAPVLELAKDGDLVTDVVEPDGRVDAGDQIDYTLTATNAGNTTLHDVTITDTKLPELVCTPDQPATLAPGDTLACTASHTLTQADIDAGRFVNSATADSNQTATTPPASETVELPPEPGLSLAKSGKLDPTVKLPTDRVDAGDRIDYTLTATNTGNTTLHHVTITDTKLGTLSCTPAQPVDALAPGDTLECKGSYTLLQADLEAGQVMNSATAGSDETSAPPASETVPLTKAPGLSLVKDGELVTTVVSPNDRADVGDRVDYTLTATNTGNTTLTGVSIDDPDLGTLSCRAPTPLPSPSGPARLAPGQQLVCTGSRVLTQADIDAGKVDNTATAHSNETSPAQSSETVRLPRAPALTVAKTGTLDLTVVPPSERLDAGDRVQYTLTATNAGNTTLHDVTIADTLLGALTCRGPTPLPTPASPITLAPGEQLVCTGGHTITQAELDAGQIVNSATAHSTETSSPPVSKTISLPQVPALTLVKKDTLDLTIVDPGTRADVGDVVTYALTASNAGNVTLTGVTVSDPTLGTLECIGPAGQVAQPVTLAPGEDVECTGHYTLTQADIDAGRVGNTATAVSGQTQPTETPNEVSLTRVHALTLAKTGTLDTTVVAPNDRADAGDRVTYTLTATNAGNTTLHGVTIADPTLRRLTCAPMQPATLAPGQQLVCTGSRRLTQADLEAGKVDNTATARSRESRPQRASETIQLPKMPGLTLAKTGTLAAPDGSAAAGDKVDYTLTATNTGNTTLHGVDITDPALGTLTCTQPVDLAPGADLVCTGSYTLTQADLDAGKVVNSATAKSDEVSPPPTEATVLLPADPSLSLVKTGTLVAPDGRAEAGDRVEYTLTATNTGNTTLTGARITDPQLGPLTCRAPTPLPSPAGPARLAPGQQLVCTGSRTLTQAEVDAGRVDNTGTATSDQATTSTPATVVLPPEPGLTLAKTGALVAPDGRADAGDRVEYTLTATNTGNTTLHDVKITDTELGTLTCTPAQPVAALAPGAKVECTGSRTLTQAEIDAGKVENSASVVSKEVTPPPTTATVPLEPEPGLTLAKTGVLVAPDGRADAGDRVDYTLTATNTGNTTLHDVKITDTELGTLTCTPAQPVAALAPGGTLACTGSRTLTQAEIDAGHVDNSATVASTEVTPPPTTAIVPLPPEPGLTLAKTGTLVTSVVKPDGRADAGDRIEYTLTATNTGNTTLTGVSIDDPDLGTLSCRAPTPLLSPSGPARLAPGQQLVCTGSRALTQAKIDAGKVDNTATVKSDQTTPTSTPATVTVPKEPGLTLAKSGALDTTVVPPADRADAGDKVDYTLTATNTGNTTLHGVEITDTALGTLVCTPGQPATLAPGAELVCTASRALTVGDLDAGKVTNTANAKSDEAAPPPPATETVTLPGVTTLQLVKHGLLDQTVVAPADRADAGDVIRYRLVATNTGNTTLTGVRVADAKLGTLVCTPAQPATLAPGAQLRCTGRYVLTQGDVDAGNVVNTASATSDQTPTPTPAPSEVTVPQAPGLALAKRGVVDPAVVAPADRADVGDVVRYRLVATNTGNTTLHDVTIADPALGTLTCAQPVELAPGAQLVCTGRRRLTQAELDAGQVVNSATAASREVSPPPVSVTVTVPQAPGLSLVKRGVVDPTVVAPADRADAGDVIRYRLVATNTGNTTLHAVTIADATLGSLTCGQPVDLAPGAQLVCRGSRTLTQADLDAGHVDNSATVTSDEVSPPPVSVTVPVPAAPGLSLVKRGAVGPAAAAGDAVRYRLTATNTGNTTLHDVRIDDPKLGSLSCRPAQPTDLAPGEQLRCTGNYTLLQADVDGGEVANSATATSKEVSPPPASETVRLPKEPALSLVKSGAVATSDGRVAAGDRVEYTLTATNTGNATLHHVAIADPKLGTLTCTPAQPVTLAPGDKLECTGSQALTQADVDAAKIENTATARSTEASAPPASDTVPLAQAPALSLAKHGTLDTTVVAPNDRADVGDRVDYTLRATNTGNTTLHDVEITDAKLGTLTCTPAQPVDLAPGHRLDCAGSHALTQVDLDGGEVVNTATAHSTEVSSPPESELVTVPRLPPPSPALSLVKRAEETSFDHVDAVLHYAYVVTNTGSVPLPGPVTVVDNRTTVTCPSGPLDPGARLVCTARYRVTQADLDAGHVTNTAFARADGAASSPSTTTVGATQVASLSLLKSATPETRNYSAVGDTIHYDYDVVNTGNVSLPGPVTVTDNLTQVTCPAGDLAPDATMTCTATYRITQADLDAGSITNVATAHADGTHSNESQATVTRTGTPPPVPPPAAQPRLAIAKTPASQRVTRGGTVTFTISVTNTGNVTLTRVTVADPRVPACSRDSSTIPGLASLAPGASVSYRCSLANVGSSFTNVATATGIRSTGARVTASSAATVTATAPPLPPEHPSVTLVKGPTMQTVVRHGIATFFVTVTNTGNVTLHDVVVSDPRVPDCARRFASLAPGTSASYRCTLAGVRASFRHLATVRARSAAGARVLASAVLSVGVRVVRRLARERPALLIVKDPDLQTVAPGTRATFRVIVRNVGDVTLHDVSVVDRPTPECARTIGTLAVGQTATYSCRSVPVFRDFTNRAQVSGVSPRGVTAGARDYVVVLVRTAAPPVSAAAPPLTG